RTIAKNLGCSKAAVYNTLKRLRQTEPKAFVQENGENLGLSTHIPRYKPAITEAHCQIHLE
ncbi:2306_t:CDS:2, partial [Funneliformis geosporum]